MPDLRTRRTGSKLSKKEIFFAFATVFISQIPNIKCLCLDYSFVWLDGYPGRMAKHALFSPDTALSKFESLQLVDYGGNVSSPETWTWDSEQIQDSFPASCNNDQFLAWFHLPSLRHLEVWLRDITGLKKKPVTNLTRLQTLILARATIAEEDVTILLAQTQSLRNLHLGLACDRRNRQHFPNDKLIVQAFESVRNTVENLSIGFEFYPCREDDHGEEKREELQEPFCGMLNNFSNLRTVEIPITILLGANPEEAPDLGTVLPSTLYKLGLKNDLVSHIGYLWGASSILDRVHDSLATKDWRSSTPQLQDIRFGLCLNYDLDVLSGNVRQLQITCEEEGISCDIADAGFSSGFWTRQRPKRKRCFYFYETFTVPCFRVDVLEHALEYNWL